MAAIISTKFRVLNATNFIDEFSESGNSFYLGIGKSDAWSNSYSDVTDTLPFVPNDHIEDFALVKHNLIGAKKLGSSDVSYMVRRYNWTSGTSYVPWDSNDVDIFDKSFYVVTDEYKVYKCLVASGLSTIKPTHTTAAPDTKSDGYVWKYMFTISTVDVTKFLTNTYMPVKTVSLDYASDALAQAALSEGDYAQYLNQKASRDLTNAGGIERIEVVSAGSGYSAAPTVTITGDGTGATATATMAGSGSNQTIASISVTNKGTDYTISNVSVTGNGTLRGVIAPNNIEGIGHGIDPVNELGGFYVGLNTQFTGNEGGDITTDNDFRQISVIKNPEKNGSVVTSSTINPLRYLDVNSSGFTGTIAADNVITGGTSGAIGLVVNVDVSGGRIYFTQNEKTGFEDFDNSETVSNGSGGSATLETTNAQVEGEISLSTGDIIYFENTNRTTRSATGSENTTAIIEF